MIFFLKLIKVFWYTEFIGKTTDERNVMKALFDKLENKKVAVFDNDWAIEIYLKGCEAMNNEMTWFNYAEDADNMKTRNMYMRFSNEYGAKVGFAAEMLNDVFGMNLSRMHFDDCLFELI